MCAGLKGLHNSVLSHEGPHREPVPQCLCKGHKVRVDIKVLIGEELAGSSNACLHFVEDEEDIPFFCNSAKGFNIVLISDIYTAFGLDELQHDSACCLADRLLQ